MSMSFYYIVESTFSEKCYHASVGEGFYTYLFKAVECQIWNNDIHYQITHTTCTIQANVNVLCKMIRFLPMRKRRIDLLF